MTTALKIYETSANFYEITRWLSLLRAVPHVALPALRLTFLLLIRALCQLSPVTSQDHLFISKRMTRKYPSILSYIIFSVN